MEKLGFNKSGQWSFEVAQPLRKNDDSYKVPTGTHTVEVHPDMDHLYRVKGMIKDSGKPHMQIGDIKRAGISDSIINKLPRDPHGKVTPDMIDKHIDSLPKKKVNVNVDDYTWGAQQHRDGPQKVISVGMHPETKAKMNDNEKNTWDKINSKQHNLNPNNKDQIGWGRVDLHSKPGHWHVDEIQSDFQNKDKIDSRAKSYDDDTELHNAKHQVHEDISLNKEHPDHHIYKDYEEAKKGTYGNASPDFQMKPGEKTYEFSERMKQHPNHIKFEEKRKNWADHVDKVATQKVADEKSKPKASTEQMHKLLSHGHEDPQHLVHSAINELARKHNVNSMSMDTPQDQAKQSMLREHEENYHTGDEASDLQDAARAEHTEDTKNHLNEHFTPEHIEKTKEETKNPNLKSALGKVPHDTLKHILGHASNAGSFGETPSYTIGDYFDGESTREDDAIRKLSDPEKHALQEHLNGYLTNKMPKWSDYNPLDGVGDGYGGAGDDALPIGDEQEDESEKAALPVHQIDTYNKRPKKLGYKTVDKASVLGSHPHDHAKHVQYTKVHKSLELIIAVAKLTGDTEKLEKALALVKGLRS